ncbi:hypothetical protein OHR68_36050 [Spirillospora sp. NBC_00431]
MPVSEASAEQAMRATLRRDGATTAKMVKYPFIRGTFQASFIRRFSMR